LSFCVDGGFGVAVDDRFDTSSFQSLRKVSDEEFCATVMKGDAMMAIRTANFLLAA
jgi:hypothetical protein